MSRPAYTEEELLLWHTFRGTRSFLEASGSCGCYHCLEIFDQSEVLEEAGDGQLLCPRCGVDSLFVGDRCTKVTKSKLRAMHARWFGEREALSGARMGQ